MAADPETDEIGYCVHALAAHSADPDRIYRQDHSGVYRTADGGDTWERAEQGLPAVFGFPIAMDPHTRALYVVPQQSDEFRYAPEGRLRVYRSSDGADTWEPLARGLPEQPAFTGVLRGALAVDGLDPAGVYFGTTAGTVHASSDGGETWTSFPWLLPRILTVDVLETG